MGLLFSFGGRGGGLGVVSATQCQGTLLCGREPRREELHGLHWAAVRAWPATVWAEPVEVGEGEGAVARSVDEAGSWRTLRWGRCSPPGASWESGTPPDSGSDAPPVRGGWWSPKGEEVGAGEEEGPVGGTGDYCCWAAAGTPGPAGEGEVVGGRSQSRVEAAGRSSAGADAAAWAWPC